jgi:hypothetical protein
MKKDQKRIRHEYAPKSQEQSGYIFGVSKMVRPGVEQYQPGGHWTDIENARYAAYIVHNSKEIEGKKHNQLWNLFKDMADFVKTRNFRQCRNHHLQYCRDHHSIPAILEHLSNSSNFQLHFCSAQAVLQQPHSLPPVNAVSSPPLADHFQLTKLCEDDGGPTGTSYDLQDLPSLEHEWKQTQQQLSQFSSTVLLPESIYPLTAKELPHQMPHRFDGPFFGSTREE